MRLLVWLALAGYACALGSDALLVALALFAIAGGSWLIPSNGKL